MADTGEALAALGLLPISDSARAAGVSRTVIGYLVGKRLVETRVVPGRNGWFVVQDSLERYLGAHPEIPRGKPARRTARFDILERDGFACRYCGRRPPEVVLEVDHVFPRSAGGPDDPSNLVTACRDCNQGKRTRILAEPGVENQ